MNYALSCWLANRAVPVGLNFAVAKSSKFFVILSDRKQSTYLTGEKMKKLFLIFAMLFLVFEVAAEGQESAQLRLVRTITLSPDVKGHFDHFEVDLKSGRIFANPQSYKAMLVFDFKTDEIIRSISVH